MAHHFRLDPSDLIVDRFIPDIRPYFPQPAHVRILVVLDERGISPGPPGSGFALGRVVAYLRDEDFGFVNFEVHFAQRGGDPSPTAVTINAGAGEWDYRYAGFRYHSEDGGAPIINGYDELWCFGFDPFINDNGTNDEVRGDDSSPTAAELAVLSDWMDAGGGVLAMGDHNFLGSAMCWNIPRVGTMRAWLKDDDDARSVPNRTGPDRHDTNRPATDAQDPDETADPAQIPNSVETDLVTQPLDWKQYSVWSPFVLQERYRPHPVLCGGPLGVLDRLPDHPHEGLVIRDDLIDLTATCWHDEGKDEYPSAGGTQPAPEVIAWVDTLATPPHNHQKGPQPARHFPAIGVYNGHEIEHGRVLVDSTWHHWLDYNIAALQEADTEEFRKIQRYHQNVAIWLAPQAEQRRMLRYAAFWTVLSTHAYEELTLDTPVLVLGGQAIDILGRATSECLVSEWLYDLIPFPFREEIRFREPLPEPCWSCPPFELLTRAVMGGVVRELLPHRETLVQQSWGASEVPAGIDEATFEAAFSAGLQQGLETAVESLEANQGVLEEAAKRARKGLKGLDFDTGKGRGPKDPNCD